MTAKNRTEPSTPTPALEAILEAIHNLTLRGLNEIFSSGQMAALHAHSEIQRTPVSRNKTGPFYEQFYRLQNIIVALLADSYRRYLKVAMVRPRDAGDDPDKWARTQLQPGVSATLEYIRDWYILACDGENECVRNVGSGTFVPGQTISVSIPLTAPPSPPPESWRTPAWLFQIGPIVGIGPLKDKHVPASDSDEKLGAAHTRLLLKGARRVFLWELEAAIEIVQSEEIAAAGAIPEQTTGGEQSGEPKKPKHWLKGTVGLGQKKADLSRYMHGLTDKQQLAASLKWEYELGLTEIASRMGLDRKTAYEHIEAAQRKIDQARSNEKRSSRTKSTPE